MATFTDLIQGIVVETRTPSWMGDLFYSDRFVYSDDWDIAFGCQPFLNEWACVSTLGRLAGITRMCLAVIHTVGELFLSAWTFDRGHLYHAAKGGCEFLRGLIETIPFVGYSFANSYKESGLWWMIKIYNPKEPDSLDRHCGNWEYFKSHRPTGYVAC